MKKFQIIIIIGLLVLLIIPAAVACDDSDKDIVGNLEDDSRFKNLVTSIKLADEGELVKTLQGDGPFTIFAPTDDAFEKLPADGFEGLDLGDIVLYHVVEGELMEADLVKLDSATTVQGDDVTITVDGGDVFINDAKVIETDIEASNGVIHVIDTVLIPEEDDIVDIAVADDRFETLVTALQAADLVETLQGEGPFTVFAPTDDAFDTLPAGTLEALLDDIPALTDILLYHVVSGKVMAADVVELDSATTVQGDDVTITVDGSDVFINDAQVIETDIEASNGVIHVIDAVLIPAS